MARRRTFTVFCGANGCVFLKSGLSRREADREATSHAAVAGPGHPVSRVEDSSSPAAGR